MRKIERRAFVSVILALAFAAGLVLFTGRYLTRGGRWASAAFNRHLYDTEGVLKEGTVVDRDGDVLSEYRDGKRRYYENETVRRATLHAVGDRNIGTGALNAFAGKLSGWNLLNGAYGAAGGELRLCIDARYNYEAYQALNGRAGTVAVYNYRTGEILCMVSSPSYDPLNIPDDIETNERYQGAYLNRFLGAALTPGSVYKTVTLAAALETIPDLESRSWECTGSVSVGEETIVCSGVHGTQNIGEAFANSCNCAFAQIAAEVGAEALAAQTEKAGLTSSYSVDGLPTARGSFDWDALSLGRLGWAGVGQDRDLVNPCAMMVYMGAIANGGRAAVPRLILGSKSALGLPSLPKFPAKTGALVDRETAGKLTEFLAGNVAKTYGTDRFPNMDLCAKSGTAEVGGGKEPHAWFAGFLRNEDAPYAFVVAVENGGGGNRVAGGIAGKVLDVIVNGY